MARGTATWTAAPALVSPRRGFSLSLPPCCECVAWGVAFIIANSVAAHAQGVEDVSQLVEFLPEQGLKLTGPHPLSLPLKFFELGHRPLQTFPGHTAQTACGQVCS